MLGSNPSADSVASTDPLRGCFDIPFQSLPCREPQHRERHQAINPGVRGQSPCTLRQPQNFFLSRAPLIMRALAITLIKRAVTSQLAAITHYKKGALVE